MLWHGRRVQYPHQWLIIEAIEAHTEGDQRRLERIAVVETCPDGVAALERYRQLHLQHPLRELYFVHTDRDELDIRERQWLDIMHSTQRRQGYA